MIEPGVFKHYKKGFLYRVLFVATWAHQSEWLVSDADLLVAMVSVTGQQTVIVQRAPETNGGAFRGAPMFAAKWSGNDGHLGSMDPLVVYVGLYGHGRVSVRALKEFEENVKETGGPRFERIGS